MTETPVTEPTAAEQADTPATDHATGEPAIVVDAVSKRFRMFKDRPTNLKEKLTTRSRGSRGEDFWALRDVSLTIPRAARTG